MVKPLLLKSSIKRSSRLMASHASKFLSDRVQADGVDKNVWEWAEKRIKNSLNFQNIQVRWTWFTIFLRLAKGQKLLLETTRIIVTILLLWNEHVFQVQTIFRLLFSAQRRSNSLEWQWNTKLWMSDKDFPIFHLLFTSWKV